MKRLLIAVLTLGLALGIFASCDLEPDPVIDINGTWNLSKIGDAHVEYLSGTSGTITVSGGDTFTFILTITSTGEISRNGTVVKITEYDYDFDFSDGNEVGRYTISEDGTSLTTVYVEDVTYTYTKQ